jgi:hypothetical protein
MLEKTAAIGFAMFLPLPLQLHQAVQDPKYKKLPWKIR